MEFPLQFSRWKGAHAAGTYAFGEDVNPPTARPASVNPNGTNNPGNTQNALNAKITSKDGWPAHRLTVLWLPPGGSADAQVNGTLYFWEEKSASWWRIGAAATPLKMSVPNFFDCMTPMEGAPVGLTGSQVGNSSQLLFVPTDAGTAVAGEHKFFLAVDLTGAGASEVMGSVTATGATTPGDTDANPTTAVETAAKIQGWTGTAWVRIKAGLAGTITAVTGLLNTLGVTKFNSTKPTLVDGQFTEHQGTSRGAMLVALDELPQAQNDTDRVIHVTERAVSTSEGAWTAGNSGTTKVGTAGLVIKSSAGNLRRIGASNTHATATAWLVLVDKTTAPVANDAVVAHIQLPPQVAGSMVPVPPLDFGLIGKRFTAGVSYAISTTPEKVTLPVSADCHVWWDVSA